MHAYAQPSVFLQHRPGDTESDCMGLNGGADAIHVQGQRDEYWVQAVNVERGTEEVEVWTSDQGFVTQARFTWPLEAALRLVRKYFDEGVLDDSGPWE
jgi:hypothetical protein